MEDGAGGGSDWVWMIRRRYHRNGRQELSFAIIGQLVHSMEMGVVHIFSLQEYLREIAKQCILSEVPVKIVSTPDTFTCVCCLAAMREQLIPLGAPVFATHLRHGQTRNVQTSSVHPALVFGR